MKSWQKSSLAILGVALMVALAVHAQFNSDPLSDSPPTSPDSIVQLTADAYGLELVAREDLPRTGTFWEVLPYGLMAPLPAPPTDTNLPIYQIADGQYLIDATGGQVGISARQAQTMTVAAVVEAQGNAIANLIEQVQETQFYRETAMMFGLEMEWEGGYMESMMGFSFDTNSLWLEITNISNGTVHSQLHNATNQVYAIWGTTDLLVPWRVEKTIWPADTNSESFTVQTANREILFLRAEDWTGKDSNADGVPDWWAWQYFGDVGLVLTNLDYSGSGLTFAEDYTNSITPTVFTFSSIQAVNNYVQTSAPTVQLAVEGDPYYLAVLVDDTNFANAVWNPCSGSSVTVDLGSVEGWHDVWIGLRGHGDDTDMAVWRWKRLKLDTTAPSLVITGPTSATVDVPMIQLTGFSPEKLGTISYDLSNATGTVTNQQVLITDQHYNAGMWEFTTNIFQAFDVGLTNGVNTFTLHATDLAGNATTLVTNITVDYTGKAAPTVEFIWPQNDMVVCGESFSWHGQLSDPTASVTAQMVDTNGTTNVFDGAVGRDGKFWFMSLPLTSGTNLFQLIVQDAAANMVTTNLTVIQGDGLTIDPIAPNQKTVTGTLTAEGCTVEVNGVTASINGTNWTAPNVPLPPNASLVKACATPTNSGASTLNTSAVANNSGEYLESYTGSYHDHYDIYTNNVLCGTHDLEVAMNWANGAGGTNTAHWLEIGAYAPWWSPGYYEEFYTNTWPATAWPDALPAGLTYDDGDGWMIATHNAAMGNQACNSGFAQSWRYVWPAPSVGETVVKERFVESGQAKLTLATGGEPGSTNESLWRVSASAMARQFIASSDGIDDPPPGWANGPIAFTNIVAGVFGPLDEQGYAYKLLPDNTNVDVTPYVPGCDYYTFIDPPEKLELVISWTGGAVITNLEKVIVGQKIGLTCGWKGGDGPAITNYSWTVPGITFSNYVADNNTGKLYTDFPKTNGNVDFYWVSGGTNQITCDITANGQPLTATISVVVKRPKAQINAWGGQVAIRNVNGHYQLYLGAQLYDAQGMKFGGIVNVPEPFTGENQWVQLASYSENLQTNDGSGTWIPYVSPSDALDTFYPYPTGNQFYGAEMYSITTTDSPHSVGLDNYVGVVRNDAFCMWLMFKPTGGQWVPLRSVSWGWNGTGTYSTNTGWHSSCVLPSPSIGNDTESFTHPVWTTNVIYFFAKP